MHGWLRWATHQHCKVWSKSDERWRPHTGVKSPGGVTFFFLVSRARAQPERGGRFACEMAQKTRIGARTCLLGARVVTNLGTGFKNLENPQNWAWNRGFPCKRKCQLSQKRYKIRKKCQRKSNRKVGVAFRMVPFGLTSGSRLTPKWKVKGHRKYVSGITRKRLEIDQKCQCKSNRKVGMAFRMVPFGLTSGSRLAPKRKVKGHRKYVSGITRKCFEIDKKCQWEANRNLSMAFRMAPPVLTPGLRLTQKLKVKGHRT